MSVGLFQLLILVGILLVVFDRSRLPRLKKSMSEFLRALKSGAQGKEDIDVTNDSQNKQQNSSQN